MNGLKALVLKERAWTPERLGANVSGDSPRLLTSLNGTFFVRVLVKNLHGSEWPASTQSPLHPCCFYAPHGRTRVLRGHMYHLGAEACVCLSEAAPHGRPLVEMRCCVFCKYFLRLWPIFSFS